MKTFKIDPHDGFKVLSSTRKSQAATMVIGPGSSEGGPGNKHTGDQWLYVIEGSGEAIVSGKEVKLGADCLLEISAGEEHEIRNTGKTPLRTLNFYAPPVF